MFFCNLINSINNNNNRFKIIRSILNVPLLRL